MIKRECSIHGYMGDNMRLQAIIKFLAGSVLLPGILLASVNSAAEEKKVDTKKVDTEVKELSGISIIGNKEAPKSLYIVPWQNSEVGVETSLSSGLLDDNMQPIDKDVFLRELEFYKLSHGKQ